MASLRQSPTPLGSPVVLAPFRSSRPVKRGSSPRARLEAEWVFHFVVSTPPSHTNIEWVAMFAGLIGCLLFYPVLR